MKDLTTLTLAEARDGLTKGDFTSRELTEQHLSAMESARELNSFIVETADIALEMADNADRMIKAGNATGMTGIPIAVKDLFCTKDVHSCSASHILNGFKPKYESTVTSNLWQDGAVMLGKTNMDEFAMGSSNETSFYGRPDQRRFYLSRADGTAS